MINLMNGDCLDLMKSIPDNSVDLVLTDPPYGTTQNKWDSVIDLDKMWTEIVRVTKDTSAIVMTSSQPFTSILITSNLQMFKYEWVWVKTKITGVLNAKKMPVRKHENVLVFYKNQPIYNAQGLVKKGTVTKQGGNSSNYGDRSSLDYVQEYTNWPRDVLEIKSEGKTIHPTQKPVELMEYMINTYTNENDVVLDFTMGSGTTGVACVKTKRSFIGIEIDKEYFDIAKDRIDKEQQSLSLF